ncbi:hypothetical protein V1281_001450 [Nitrobacteraceae bacterium AZCC 2161]
MNQSVAPFCLALLTANSRRRGLFNASCLGDFDEKAFFCLLRHVIRLAEPMTVPIAAKTALVQLAGGLHACGLKVEKPVFSGRKERWCDLADWKDALGKPITICVCVFPYLGVKHSFWVGFYSKDKTRVTRLADVYKSTYDKSLPELYSSHWTDSMKLKPTGMRCRPWPRWPC